MTDERHESEDQALDDPVFEELFAAMRATARRPAPPMSPALTMLLAPGALGRRRRARNATVGLAVFGVLAGGVGAAAATGHLQRPAPVNRVADDSSGATTQPAPPTEAVTPPATEPEPGPEATDGEDRTADVSGDDETTRPTRRPPTSDDDDTPGTEESGSDDDGDHGDDAEEGDEGDGGDDSGAQEPGDDEHPDEGDEVDDGSAEDDGHSDVADAPDDDGEGADSAG
jgi:hypothetical protein